MSINFPPEENQPEGRGDHRDFFRRERRLRNWSQEDLAQKVGTARGSISRWGQGDVLPNRHSIRKFCDVFGKQRRELFPSLGTHQRQGVLSGPVDLEQRGREAGFEGLKRVESGPVEHIATVEEEAYRLRLGERRIEGLRSSLDRQIQLLTYMQAIACQVLQWTNPDLDEGIVLALVQQIPLTGKGKEERERLQREIEAGSW